MDFCQLPLVYQACRTLLKDLYVVSNRRYIVKIADISMGM